MLASIARLKEPKSKSDAIRLVVVYSAVSVLVSAAFTYAFAALNGWPVFSALVPAILIPLLVAPWMTWTVAGYALRLRDMQLELERLAHTDPLSGALNRRGLASFAETAFARRRQSGLFSAIVMDIDRFKTINDGYGHAAGDTVIARIVEISRRMVGPDDTAIGRLGGDELVALIEGLSLEETLILAERLRDAIEHMIFIHGDRRIRVTTSIGVSAVHPDDLDPEALLQRADRSLYDAKAAGRNRVRAAA